jgi:hypothetical protein
VAGQVPQACKVLSFTEHASQSHWQDYTCAVEHSAAVVRSAVPEPAGIAFLGQEVFADDFHDSTVAFRGEFRVQADTPGRAGLFLRVNEGHDIAVKARMAILPVPQKRCSTSAPRGSGGRRLSS